jgi:biopolymer transport protein ExbD
MRRPVTATVNVVPLLGILMFCVAFLLITQEWPAPAMIPVANGPLPGGCCDGCAPPPARLFIAGSELQLTIPDRGTFTVDRDGLASFNLDRVEIDASDTTPHAELIEVVDSLRSAGVEMIAVSMQ